MGEFNEWLGQLPHKVHAQQDTRRHIQMRSRARSRARTHSHIYLSPPQKLPKKPKTQPKNNQNTKTKVVIAGNHDRICHELGAERTQRLLSNAIYLENETVTLQLPVSAKHLDILHSEAGGGGASGAGASGAGTKETNDNNAQTHARTAAVKVHGSPLSSGHSANSAFQLPRGECAQKWQETVPNDLDVLLTHSTPRPREASPGNPRYHVCGHRHRAFGVRFASSSSSLTAASASSSPETAPGKTPLTIISCALCDHLYWPCHIPIVFDFFPQPRHFKR